MLKKWDIQKNNYKYKIDFSGLKERYKMPIVHVNVWKGFDKEKTKTVIKEITKVFVNLDIPKQAVEVIVHEIPKTNWGIAGEPASEKFKNIN
jgi:4-oxalocrotonate tautomerase